MDDSGVATDAVSEAEYTSTDSEDASASDPESGKNKNL